MKPSILLAAALLALLASAGCSNRGKVELDAYKADNARMAEELDALYQENALLKVQRDNARQELALQKAQTEGLEKQLREKLNQGAIGIEGVSVGPDGLSMDDDFAFEKGKAELTSGAVNAIRQLASLLNGADYRGTNIYVIGHTDTTPVTRPETVKRFTDNWGLSAMRAAAVTRALEKAGIQPTRLYGTFRGEHEPRASNSNADGKAQNRRVNIVVGLADR